jgi:hypothetical protein
VRVGEQVHLCGRRWALVAGLIAVVGAFLAVGLQPAFANHIAYSQGDVFAGVGGGKINHYSPTGTLLEQLDTTTGAANPPGNETGMCFDTTGKLYSTNYSAVDMSKFNSQGGLLQEPFGPDVLYPPESCVVDQPGEAMYVGLNEGDNELLKLDLNGNLLDTYFLVLDSFGISYVDLNPKNQCEIYYTSEGSLVKRFNVCTETQLTDFASGLPTGTSGCFHFRIRSNGDVLVACDQQIVRLNTSGVVVQSYNPGSEGDFFALALDPDGQSFWAAGYTSGHVYKVNIATGAVSTNYVATPAIGAGLAGLAVYGDGAAQAGFPRPKGATPVRSSLTVAYKQCTSPNRTHGGSSAVNKPSCNPPAQSSNYLTVGTGDAWAGTTPGAVGSVRYDVKTTAPEDVRINTSITDVRCKGANAVPGFCSTANTDNANVPDYSGQVQATVSLRITDRYNSSDPATQPLNDPGTTSDVSFPVSVPCGTTSTTTIGSTCSLATYANAIAPNALNDNFRTIWQFGQVQVNDGGSDGVASTVGNTLFMDEGIWVP